MTTSADDEELKRQQELAELAAFGTRGWATRGWLQIFFLVAALLACLGAVVFLRPLFQNATVSSKSISWGIPPSPQYTFRPGQSDGTLYFVDTPKDITTTDIFTRAITVTQAIALNLTKSPDYSELLLALAPNDDRVAYIGVSKGGDRSVRVLRAGSGPVDISSRLDKTCVVDLALPPAWSPDGAWIAFLAECNVQGGKTVQLFAARPDGAEVRKLTQSIARVTEARWLDNQTLIFGESDGKSTGAIYLAPVAGPPPTTPMVNVTVPK